MTAKRKEGCLEARSSLEWDELAKKFEEVIELPTLQGKGVADAAWCEALAEFKGLGDITTTALNVAIKKSSLLEPKESASDQKRNRINGKRTVFYFILTKQKPKPDALKKGEWVDAYEANRLKRSARQKLQVLVGSAGTIRTTKTRKVLMLKKKKWERRCKKD